MIIIKIVTRHVWKPGGLLSHLPCLNKVDWLKGMDIEERTWGGGGGGSCPLKSLATKFTWLYKLKIGSTGSSNVILWIELNMTLVGHSS